MVEEGETLELYNLHYSDLMALSSSDQSLPTAYENMEYLESVMSTIMKNLGPSGPGLLAINGVPNSSVLRRTLLSMAPKLALLNHEDRKRLLKVFRMKLKCKSLFPDMLMKCLMKCLNQLK